MKFLTSSFSCTFFFFQYILASQVDNVCSGYPGFETVYARNESTVLRQAVTVNVVNAPNDSTLQCGCENINCPLCNFNLNLQFTDPNVLLWW